MAKMLQKPVFALPGCQQMSVNTLLCDTLALAEQREGFGTLPLVCSPPVSVFGRARFLLDLRPPSEIRKKWPKTRKMAPNPNFDPFLGRFPDYGQFFSDFLGEAKTFFLFLLYSPIFSYFRPEAQNGVCTRQTGSQCLTQSCYHAMPGKGQECRQRGAQA